MLSKDIQIFILFFTYFLSYLNKFGPIYLNTFSVILNPKHLTLSKSLVMFCLIFSTCFKSLLGTGLILWPNATAKFKSNRILESRSIWLNSNRKAKHIWTRLYQFDCYISRHYSMEISDSQIHPTNWLWSLANQLYENKK